MSGDTLQDFAKGWTDRQVVNVLDWDINDVFNDGDTRRLAGTVTRRRLAPLWSLPEFEVEPLTK